MLFAKTHHDHRPPQQSEPTTVSSTQALLPTRRPIEASIQVTEPHTHLTMSSSPIIELLGSPQVVVGFGATTLVLLATTFFYLKNNEGSNGRGAASSSSALEKAEELDSEVRRDFFYYISTYIYEKSMLYTTYAHFFPLPFILYTQ